MTKINTGNTIDDDKSSLRSFYEVLKLSKNPEHNVPGVQSIKIKDQTLYIVPKMQDTREINIPPQNILNNFLISNMSSFLKKMKEYDTVDSSPVPQIKPKSFSTSDSKKSYDLSDYSKFASTFFKDASGEEIEGPNSFTVTDILLFGFLPSYIYAKKGIRLNNNEDVNLSVSGIQGTHTLQFNNPEDPNIQKLKVGMILDTNDAQIPYGTVVISINLPLCEISNDLTGDLNDDIFFDSKPKYRIEDKQILTTNGKSFYRINESETETSYVIDITYSFPINYRINIDRNLMKYNPNDDTNTTLDTTKFMLSRSSTVSCTQRYKVTGPVIRRAIIGKEWMCILSKENDTNLITLEITDPQLSDEKHLLEYGLKIVAQPDGFFKGKRIYGQYDDEKYTFYISDSVPGSPGKYYLSKKYRGENKISADFKAGSGKCKFLYGENDMTYALLQSIHSDLITIQIETNETNLLSVNKRERCVSQESFSQKIEDQLALDIQRDIDNILGLLDKGLGTVERGSGASIFYPLDKNNTTSSTSIADELKGNIKPSKNDPCSLVYTKYNIDLSDIIISPNEFGGEGLDSVWPYISKISVPNKFSFVCEDYQNLQDLGPIDTWIKQ